ncbi:MAG: hypothetical protein B7Z12_14245 [Caulobacter vibrioides]|jgi:hypothetical protein|uniref:Uncharacterized protein n=1 Tax=Caulobacter vibrioides TaxID=155892 RepID=A0A258D0Z3_CAUVI|nr:MAG: hypothetical protein B7Z12_14245 [Caulobacter vibrioides]
MAAFARDVFINCPFDPAYRVMFRAIVFAITRSGFRARCALEVDDSSQNRWSLISDIVDQCRYGVHDISRTELDGDPPLPRFNMPLELGLFLGAKRFGDQIQKRKRCLVLDKERYRYQRFISDLAGQDIHGHGNDPTVCIEVVATWLRVQSRSKTVPGGRAMAREFEAFELALPQLCAGLQLEIDEMTFGDLTSLASEYIAAAL